MPQQAPQQTNQTPDLSQYEVKPGASGDLSQYEVKPAPQESTRAGQSGRAYIPVPGEPRMVAVDTTPGEEKNTENEFDRATSVPGGIAGTYLASSVLGNTAAKPIARAFKSYVEPGLRLVPWVNKAVIAAEEAPSVMKAIAGGAAAGGTTGGIEGLLRNRDFKTALKDAGWGALIGGGLSGGVYGVDKLAAPEIAPEAIDTPREPIMGPNEPAPVPKPFMSAAEVIAAKRANYELGLYNSAGPGRAKVYAGGGGGLTNGLQLPFTTEAGLRVPTPIIDATEKWGGRLLPMAPFVAAGYELNQHYKNPGPGLKFDETPLPTDKIITPLIAPSPKQIDAATGKKGVEHKSLIQPHKTIQRTESEHGNIPQNAIGVLQNKAGTTIGWYDQEGHHLFPKEK